MSYALHRRFHIAVEMQESRKICYEEQIIQQSNQKPEEKKGEGEETDLHSESRRTKPSTANNMIIILTDSIDQQLRNLSLIKTIYILTHSSLHSRFLTTLLAKFACAHTLISKTIVPPQKLKSETVDEILRRCYIHVKSEN